MSWVFGSKDTRKKETDGIMIKKKKKKKTETDISVEGLYIAM